MCDCWTLDVAVCPRRTHQEEALPPQPLFALRSPGRQSPASFATSRLAPWMWHVLVREVADSEEVQSADGDARESSQTGVCVESAERLRYRAAL